MVKHSIFLSLQNVKRIIIEILFYSHLRDHGNWCFPKYIVIIFTAWFSVCRTSVHCEVKWVPGNIFLPPDYTVQTFLFKVCKVWTIQRWYLKRTKGKSTKAILVDLALVWNGSIWPFWFKSTKIHFILVCF